MLKNDIRLRKYEEKNLKKSRKLYITMMTVWLLLIACFIPAFLNEYRFSDSILINILLTLNGIFIMLDSKKFWQSDSRMISDWI